LSSAITVDEAVKKRPFTERFRFLIFFSNLIGTKVIHQCESGQSSGLYFFRCNEGTGSGTEDKKILDSSESRLAVTRRFCQFFSCRQGSQTNNEGQYHLPIRSSWQKIETDCERGDAGRIKNLFCSFSNRKYVVFF